MGHLQGKNTVTYATIVIPTVAAINETLALLKGGCFIVLRINVVVIPPPQGEVQRSLGEG